MRTYTKISRLFLRSFHFKLLLRLQLRRGYSSIKSVIAFLTYHMFWPQEENNRVTQTTKGVTKSVFLGATHSTKISGNFGLKLNGSVRSNRKSFENTGPPFEVDLFSRSDRSDRWLNGSRPLFP